MQLQNRIIRLPLFWKFVISATIIIVIFGSINIYFLWTSVYTSFEKEINKRCKVLAKIVSENALSPMVYEDIFELHTILNEIKQSDPSISYIFILNNSNNLIAETFDVNITQGLINVNSLNSQKYNIKLIETSNYEYPVIRDIAYPILNGEVGTVRLGIVEEHIQQEMMSASKKLLIMILGFLIFGLSGAFFFSYLITSPIKIISNKAQEIDLNSIDSANYNIYSRKRKHFFNIQIIDELDVLVTKFSEMLNRLKNSYSELKKTQRALVQAEKMALLGTLSAGVAHEINNPISGIKNCINRIITDPENLEQNKKYIFLIKDATNKIEDVVKHLLNFSRKQDIYLKKTNLNTVIDKAILLTTHKLRNSNINIETNYKQIYHINGSTNHLEQIFVNLILNSIDAIVEKKENETNLVGKISITVKQKHEKIIVIFNDNGQGIPEKIRSKIFDPFFTSKKIGKGTGLGLSVSFNLIKEHGGNIFFNSIEGAGTEFFIELNNYLKK